ncbi:MAG: SDR family NAD(P)-dependent oxidoreductase [Deltaproteobacteria bacterium]|nr:SDR family NAD(P)-dependent oxidoreductase [Deltaproteobacteria bacterium]
MRALITGAGGFIGSFLIQELVKKGYLVRALFLPGEDATKSEALGVEVARGDITSPETLSGIAADVDVVYHLAGRVLDWGPDRLFFETIVDGTRHLLEACRSTPIRRFIYFSSVAALGYSRDQVGLDEEAERVRSGIPYCDAKIEAEDLVAEFCQTNQIPYTIVRPANVIGPGSVWVKDLLDTYYRGPLPLIAGGTKPGAFVFVRNLVDGVLLAAESEKAVNRIYHFRDDTGLTWGEFFTSVGSWIDKKPSGNIPYALARRLGAFFEAVYSPTSLRPPLSRLAAGAMGRDNDVDVSRARAELGWVSRTGPAEGMKEIEEWVKQEYRPPGRTIDRCFQNRLVFVTGGSSGIGLETARLLAAKGAHIVLLARDLKKLAAAREEIESSRRAPHQRVATISVDVTDMAELQAKLDKAVVELGPPDILINSAGVPRGDYFERISLEQFDRVIKTNLYGVRNTTAALLPRMKARGGQIVIISSAAGLVGVYGYSAYCSSQFAVVGLAECLRSELKRHGISVTLVCPPEVNTPVLTEKAETLPPEARAVKGLAGTLTPEYTAIKTVEAVQKKRFLTIPGRVFPLQYFAHSLSVGTTTRFISDAVIRRVLRRKSPGG